MSVINSYTNWSPLEEVWLGDVYPASWYNHLPGEVRDCFQDLTERTQQDLKIIQHKLESLGVTVCRPCYDHIDNYIDPSTQQLMKPEICPRDYYVTVGKTLYAKRYASHAGPWKQHLDNYERQGGNIDSMLWAPELSLNGACMVRAGKDLYIDLVWNDNQTKEFLINCFKKHFAEKFKDYRIHLLFNGGHVDSCFSLLANGIILGTKYFSDYEKTFPGWQLINITRPEFSTHSGFRESQAPAHNGKWWLPGFAHSQAFSTHVIQHAQTWIGDYTETFFEVNCLVIDEKNVIIPGDNQTVFRHLEKLGITAHSVPFRTRTFWDGGMHCITLDIRRRGACQDLFPERGEPKITVYD